MIYKPIYRPKARAREYGDLAINIYTGCNHGCAYCYARAMAERYTPKGCVCAFGSPEPRRDIVESVRRQLKRERITGKLIHLCFSCDPYPADIDTDATRETIRLIKESGNNVQILTKGGRRAHRDFDLLGGGDWFGVTHTNDKWFRPYWREPNAATASERLTTLEMAKKQGIATWVSLEPVFDPETVYSLIKTADYIDVFKIGKLNYAPSDIDWAQFGAKCVELCENHGRACYIKNDLWKEMEKGGVIDFSVCPYWRKDGCAGFNCCAELYCPHARESQPILFESEERNSR
jgi:DNA repair photolyase